MYQCQRELHQWVRRIKRPISDVEDVVETLITYVKKSVLLADSVNPKNSEDTAGRIKNQLLGKDWYKLVKFRRLFNNLHQTTFFRKYSILY